MARAPAGIVVGEGAAGKRLKPAAGMENASAGDGGGAGTGADSDEINPVTGVPEGMIMCGGVIYTGPDPRESGYPIGRYGLRYGRRMGR